MVNAGVSCVKPDYIAVYLTDDPPPTADLHYIPEVLPLVSNLRYIQTLTYMYLSIYIFRNIYYAVSLNDNNNNNNTLLMTRHMSMK